MNVSHSVRWRAHVASVPRVASPRRLTVGAELAPDRSYRTNSAAPAGTRPARLTIAPSLNLTHASPGAVCDRPATSTGAR